MDARIVNLRPYSGDVGRRTGLGLGLGAALGLTSALRAGSLYALV